MPKKKSRIKFRGFAALKLRDPQRLLEVTSKGGKTAHERGVAHLWTSETAKIAGQKGLDRRNAKSNRTNT